MNGLARVVENRSAEAGADAARWSWLRPMARILCGLSLLAALAIGYLSYETRRALLPLPERLSALAGGAVEGASAPGGPPARVTDRFGETLAHAYDGGYNTTDVVAFHAAPALLRDAFLYAEDQRFFAHEGVDWRARGHAVLQNVAARRAVRGASTITEQVVRILHPRPRSLWSRWLEGVEARRLERAFGKAEIFEFYLNQVPYGRQRRGVVQAARLYFDRDLDTLAPVEMLTLAVLVRSPSRLDPLRDERAVMPGVERLARRLAAAGRLDEAELAGVLGARLSVGRGGAESAGREVEAMHWAGRVRNESESDPGHAPSSHGRTGRAVRSTLDASLQDRVQRILDSELERLATRQVSDGAVVVLDHTSDEILAWVNGGGFGKAEGGQIDKITTPRQPGSTLKPFLYAMALERGWTAATLIDDAPLLDPVGHGMHSYRNYSRTFYGPVRLREALGNSLNTPAVRAVKFVGTADFHDRLRRLGLSSLVAHPDHYGEGLALGNGEVTLHALVDAYATLARGGVFRPSRSRLETGAVAGSGERLFEPEVATLIADILSDPQARRREFGTDSILNLPRQTAVKTGTSNDHRDSWALGFSHRYTVGVWMGNVDRRETLEVSGSVGPALVFRAVMAELHRHGEDRALPLSRRLVAHDVCAETGALPGVSCPTLREWFRPGFVPQSTCTLHSEDAHRGVVHAARHVVSLDSPTPGLHLALDPRIPDALERFNFGLASGIEVLRVEWRVDGELVATTGAGELRYSWPLERGHHRVQATVWPVGDAAPVETAAIGFVVK